MNRTSFRAPALSAVLCLWAAGGTAADLPPTAAPPKHAPPPPPAFSWTGFYAGAHIGGEFDESNFSNPYGPTLFGDNVRSPGGIGGLQIGYNWQYGATVLGVEADMSAADLDGTFTCLQPVRGGPFFPQPGFIGGAFGATGRSLACPSRLPPPPLAPQIDGQSLTVQREQRDRGLDRSRFCDRLDVAEELFADVAELVLPTA